MNSGGGVFISGTIRRMPKNGPFLQLTRHRRKCSGVANGVRDGSVALKCIRKPACALRKQLICAQMHYLQLRCFCHVCVHQGGSLGSFPHTSVMSEQVGVHKGGTLLLN